MAKYDLENYEKLLAEAGEFHGDICGGILISSQEVKI